MGDRGVVGVTYVTWFLDEQWPPGRRGWDKPLQGCYKSDDVSALLQHAEWLIYAGVDFVLMDWSNNCEFTYHNGSCRRDLQFLQDATLKLFETWAALPQAPKVCVMIGSPEDPGRYERDGGSMLTAKADEVYKLFVQRYPGLYFTWKGKPLLVDYAGTPCPYPNGLPPWNDPRFTVRHMTGYVSCQRNLQSAGRISRFGYWSWEERFEPTYAMVDGRPENMTVSAGHRGAGGWTDANSRQTRNNGWTFRRQWDRANAVGVDLVLVQSFNEWLTPGEELDVEHSNDIEPSRVQGTYYLEALKIEVQRFKVTHGLAPSVPLHCLPPPQQQQVAYVPLNGWVQNTPPQKYKLNVHRVDLDLNEERNSRSIFLHNEGADNARFLRDLKSGKINIVCDSSKEGTTAAYHQLAYDFPHENFHRCTYWPVDPSVRVSSFSFLKNAANYLIDVSAFLDIQRWAPLTPEVLRHTSK